METVACPVYVTRGIQRHATGMVSHEITVPAHLRLLHRPLDPAWPLPAACCAEIRLPLDRADHSAAVSLTVAAAHYA